MSVNNLVPVVRVAGAVIAHGHTLTKEATGFRGDVLQRGADRPSEIDVASVMSGNELGYEAPGANRACIACSACPDVCPVGILPQFLAKSLYNNDIEGALELGLLDCAECGLCSHICPSKIELTAIFLAKGLKEGIVIVLWQVLELWKNQHLRSLQGHKIFLRDPHPSEAIPDLL